MHANVFHSSILRNVSILSSLSILLMACPSPGKKDPNSKNTRIPTAKPVAITSLDVASIAEQNLRALFNHADARVNEFAPESESESTTNCDPLVQPNCPPNQESSEPTPDEVAKTVVELLFSAEAIEASTPTSVTYKIQVDSICDGEEEDIKECKDFFETLDLHYVVTSFGDNKLDVLLQTGAERSRAGSLGIYPEQLSVSFDLKVAKTMFDAIAPMAGEKLPFKLDRASGEIAFAVAKEGEKKISVSTSIIKKVELALGTEQGPVSFQFDRSSPLIAVTVDGTDKSISTTINSGAMDLSVPAELIAAMSKSCEVEGERYPEDPQSERSNTPERQENCESPFDGMTGIISAHFPAISALITGDLEKGKAKFQLNNLGNDDLTIRKDGQSVVQAKLAPLSGSSLEIDATMQEKGVVIDFDPSLSLSLDLALQHLMQDTSRLPSWVQDENFKLTFDGASQPSISFCDENEQKSVAKVLRGLLAISSTSENGVTVTEGRCLGVQEIEGDEEGEPPHPLSVLMAIDCP